MRVVHALLALALVPANVIAQGSIEELKKLASAVKKYYLDNRIWFDQAAFDRNVELRFAIDRLD